MTPAGTRKIAASTNDTAPNALIESFAKLRLPGMTTDFSYQGRNIVTSRPTAAVGREALVAVESPVRRAQALRAGGCGGRGRPSGRLYAGGPLVPRASADPELCGVLVAVSATNAPHSIP